jgi:hypothetical protein
MKYYFLQLSLLFLLGCKLKEPQNPPTVKTLTTSDISLNTAVLHGEVTSEGYTAAVERGFVWSAKNQNPSVSDTKIVVGYGKGEFEKQLTSLEPNTKYYVRAFATNTKGTSYGSPENFTTEDYKAPTLSTDLPKNVTFTSAELGGTATADGGSPITERGVVISLASAPTTSDIKLPSGKGLGSFAAPTSSLKENTQYYVRSYAINGKGVGYGNEQSFKTLAFKTPTVGKINAENPGRTTVTMNATVSEDGGQRIIERGFCLSTSPNPTLANLKFIASTSQVGPYAIAISNLTIKTKYYVKAYAINEKGIAWSEEISFTTLDGTLANVFTLDVQNIAETSVRAGAEVKDDGGSQVTEYGICIATNPNPTINNRKVVLGSGIAGKMENVTGLTSSTRYYIRAYGINSSGISYGREVSFLTLSPTPPIVQGLRNGLIAYYPFNGNASDASGNNLNGINYGATPTTNRYNQTNSSMKFNGKQWIWGSNGTYIYIPFNPILLTPRITVSAWVKLNSTGIDKQSLAIIRRFEFGYSNPNGETWMLDIENINSSSGQVASGTIIKQSPSPAINSNIKSNLKLALNTWYLVTMTFDGDRLKIYVNNNLQSEFTTSIQMNIQGNSGISIGLSKQANGHWSPFDGDIDDIGIWNRALTQEEINYLYQNNYQP